MHRSPPLSAPRHRRSPAPVGSPGLAAPLLTLSAALQVGPLQLLLPVAFGLALLYLAAWRHPVWMPALLALSLLGAVVMVLGAATSARLGPLHVLLAIALALWLPGFMR